MSEAERRYLESLKKAEPFTGFRGNVGQADEYKIQILGRGENAFYQEGDRALLFQVLAGQGVIFRSSIRRWDSGKKVTPEERDIPRYASLEDAIVAVRSRIQHRRP